MTTTWAILALEAIMASGPDLTCALPGADLQAPDGTPARVIGREPVPITVPAAALGATGTLAVWLKLAETVRAGRRVVPILSGAPLDLKLQERDNLVSLSLVFGVPMAVAGARPVPGLRGLLTHLSAGRWYHVAFTWNGPQPDNHFLLDGLDQGCPEPQAAPDTIRGMDPAAGPVTLRLGSPGLTVSAPCWWKSALPPETIRAAVAACGHQPYFDEGVRDTGETLRAADITDKKLLYEAGFDRAEDLDDWAREGGQSATIVDGHLRLTTGPSLTEGQHIVLWLKREIPADFVAEWRFRPYHPHEGLTIVFFNARGRGGESIFDPSLPPRDGTFTQYHSGALDCYHISYFASERGSVNLRKNHGFSLAAIGRELLHTKPVGEFSTITLLKQGGRIRLAVDGVVSLAYDDDGATYGPVHDQPGWFGLRAMLQAWHTDYDDLRIWSVPAT